jgi:hypothetical protein
VRDCCSEQAQGTAEPARPSRGPASWRRFVTARRRRAG